MEIKIFTTGPFETNCYLVIDEQTKNALLIDAPPDSSMIILKEVKERKIDIKYIINTHGHIDHIADNYFIKNELNTKILIHKEDEPYFNPSNNLKLFFASELYPTIPDGYLNDGDILSIGDFELQVIFTPGHTPGGICLLGKKQKILFTGDTIFKENIGRTDLPGGNMDVLMQSIKNKILVLDDDIVIFPGHEKSSTIGHEKKFNPFI